MIIAFIEIDFESMSTSACKTRLAFNYYLAFNRIN